MKEDSFRYYRFDIQGAAFSKRRAFLLTHPVLLYMRTTGFFPFLHTVNCARQTRMKQNLLVNVLEIVQKHFLLVMRT